VRERWPVAIAVAVGAFALPPLALAKHRTTLRPPSNLVAAAGNQQVALDWTASTSSHVGGYRVYRENSNGTWPTTPLATTSATTTTYTDIGLANGTTYTYRVTTIDTSNPPTESVPSNTGRPRRPFQPPVHAEWPRRLRLFMTTWCGL
jgi:hypothetical protein